MRLTWAFEWQQTFGSRLRFAKLPVDANPQTPGNDGVRGILVTPVLFRGQRVAPAVAYGPTDRRRAKLMQQRQAV